MSKIDNIVIVIALIAITYIIYNFTKIADIVDEAEKQTENTIEKAVNASSGSYEKFRKSLPQPVNSAVYLGNIITPTTILTSAAQAGQQVKTDIIKSGGIEKFNQLNIIEKGLVATGQAIGNLAGINLIESGKKFRSWFIN